MPNLKQWVITPVYFFWFCQLTGKVVKGGGTAVTGQDTKSYGHGFMGEVINRFFFSFYFVIRDAFQEHFKGYCWTVRGTYPGNGEA